MTHRERADRIHQLMHGYHCEDEPECVRRIEVEVTAAVREYVGLTGPYRPRLSEGEREAHLSLVDAEEGD